MKATTYDFAKVGDRMREARRALKLNQVDFYDKFVGTDHSTLRTFQRAEKGSNEAGMSLIEAFVRSGINANWLLTGEGPMLLAELTPKPAPVKINVEALGAIIEGLSKAGLPPAKLGQTAVRYYQDAIEQGLITPAGVGDGDGKASA